MIRTSLMMTLVLMLSACSGTAFFSTDQAACVVPLPLEELTALNASGQNQNVWVREENSVSIRVVTPPNLNRLERYAHGTAVGFYQMENPEAFVREIATQSGIRRLLLLQDLDASILQHDVRSLQPKSSVRFDSARVEKAKYIGVVVGYSSLVTDRTVRLIQIPLVRTTRSSLNPVNWFTDSPPAKPAQLDVLITLGSEGIEDVVVNVRAECGASG